ncbi:beta-1,4-mannosyl-glycoprotein 4-beta-N-acetylglucosaminyltransferase [Drosophila sulfurigaster albostrigata]|uniref:beta-1,4-mannosyl-glycoprotein 4-beta-N-acetylglucosaminyltransferase n=1 Tax=Drosophila sulfurigaster albostrigata TaxID=89887 RepID=UPI002D218DF3|nr:beta-1,4-mannosyl-glycoprotein 4-beta-N-acetylglucosaminyltransferase [Drosophila sulfurigaster albostrigata]
MARSMGLNHTAASGNSRRAITKKLVLWSVLIVQVGFIGCIWLLQMNRSQLLQQQNGSAADPQESGRVHFVRNARNPKKQGQQVQQHCVQRDNINQYQEDFYQMKSDNRLNRSADYALPAYIELELAPALWCYKEGTVNETTTRDRDYLMAQPQCNCESGWHGRDCGQPEIIWRALMTHSRASKRGGHEAPLKLHEASPTSIKRLYYMLSLGDWEHINMELLQLQLRTLIEVVDFFLIYYYERDSSKDQLKQRRLQRQLNSLLSSNYVLYQCSKATGQQNCSGAAAFAHFRQQLWSLCSVQLQATDLLLVGNRESIFAPTALKFLKYYATDVLPLRFRLKHNVYGFYWQHGQRARLSGVISSLVHLHAAQLDPQHLEKHAIYTLGDLNHYGGWSCQLCMSPEQIVNWLQQSGIKVQLPNKTRSARIDANYVQQLMGAGILLEDGSTQLLRLRPQSEKYFAPDVAQQHSNQFGQLLYNLYDVNDVQEDDD